MSHRFERTAPLPPYTKLKSCSTAITGPSRIPGIPKDTGPANSGASRSHKIKPSPLLSRGSRQLPAPANDDRNTFKVFTEQTASMISVDRSQPREPVRPIVSAQSSLPRNVRSTDRREGHPNAAPIESDYSIALRIRNKPPIEGRLPNVLRRKAPSIECYSKNTKIPLGSPSSDLEQVPTTMVKTGGQPEKRGGQFSRTQSPIDLPRPHQKTSPRPGLQIQQHRTPEPSADSSQLPTIPKELRGLSTTINTGNLPNSTPHIPSASTPSTLYSDSPGPWSSRTSTPTSVSSYSPNLWHPSRVGSRLRQPSPVIAGKPAQYRPPRPTPPLEKSSPAPSCSVSSSPLRNAQDLVSGTQVYEKLPMVSQKTAGSPAKIPTAAKPSSELQLPSHSQSFLNDTSMKKQEERRATKLSRDPTTQGRVKAQPSKLPTSVAPTRPSRPSRQGTLDLPLESSPVIQSNLPASRLLGHKRQDSSGTVNFSRSRSNSLRPPDESSESLASKYSLQTAQAAPPLNPSDMSGRKTVPANSRPLNQTRTSRNKEVKETRIVKEQSIDDKKRFGIFTKKSKTVPDVTGTKGDKLNRKGPMAGTGHEGYGRYAQRGRRSSVGGNTIRARSTSTSASASKSSLTSRGQPEMDDFLRDRLEPIIINGGGQDGGALARTQSEQSFSSIASTTISEPYRRLPHGGGYSTESIPTYGGYLAHSPEPFSYSTGDLTSERKGERRKQKRTVLRKRSFRKSHLFGGDKENQEAGVAASRPSIDSANTNTSVTSLSPVNHSTLAIPQDFKTEKEAKKKKSRWNFFQRSLHRKQSQADLRSVAMTEVPASVTNVPGQRQVAHYELLDNEQIDSDSLEDILRRVENSPPTEEEGTQQPPAGLGLRKQHGLSVLLPEPPAALRDHAYDKPLPSPKVFFNKENEPTFESALSGSVQVAAQKPRESRLVSVGRIPKVVHRDNTPVQSFSRPFSTAEVPSVSTTADKPTYLSPPLPPVGLDFNIPVCSEPAIPDILRSPMIYPSNLTEFFAFSPRKGSDASSSSSNSLAAVTAIIPPPGSQLTDDEIWGEYDDFIDHVMSPSDRQASVVASTRGPFNKVADASKALQEGLNDNTSTSSPPNHPAIIAPSSPELSSAKSSVHLRRSMVVSALHSSLAPSTAESFSELYNSDHARCDRDSKQETHGQSHSDQTKQPLPIPNERRLLSTNPNRKRNTILLDRAERNKYGAIAQANLRSGSLMTSRWLSFGRVLFSPAQNHVQSQQSQSRILVIDGLGNDDWSFYCALTYPTATVYNLSMSPSSATSTNPAAWDPPSNHRTAHHANIDRPFPFPKGFFTVVILRFPAACSEAELRARVSECKRVLRDGGYIELSILDLDMVNMGSRTRKAVRTLKERIFTTDPTLNLKSMSDDIQRLLGKKGFENLNRCMVVVPVAGSIVASSDTSNSGQSIKLDLDAAPKYGPKAPKPPTQPPKDRPPSEQADVSLGDLLSDPSPSESNDESIAKMVARVGRWWYTRCYESAVLLDANLDESMWSDKRLLRECQRRGTGFKLLIAYAQKPSELPRRTVSV